MQRCGRDAEVVAEAAAPGQQRAVLDALDGLSDMLQVRRPAQRRRLGRFTMHTVSCF
jgi:hypothetical protein